MRASSIVSEAGQNRMKLHVLTLFFAPSPVEGVLAAASVSPVRAARKCSARRTTREKRFSCPAAGRPQKRSATIPISHLELISRRNCTRRSRGRGATNPPTAERAAERCSDSHSFSAGLQRRCKRQLFRFRRWPSNLHRRAGPLAQRRRDRRQSDMQSRPSNGGARRRQPGRLWPCP